MRLAVLLILSSFLCAQERSLGPAFEHFYNLEYEPALAGFRGEVQKHPDSPEAFNNVAQGILYREMFRSGALESQLVTGNNAFLRRDKMNISAADDKEFTDAINRALTLAEARIQTNPQDGEALYAKGVSYGLRANFRYLVHKAWLDGLRDATEARKAHARVSMLDPANIDARLVQGVYDYLVGSLPFTWKMFGFMAGFRGDRERGVTTLKEVYARGVKNHQDAAVILCAIYRRERRAREAVPLLSELIERYPRNFLLRLELIQMFAELGEKDQALAVLAQLEQLKSTNANSVAQLSGEKLRYTRGNLLFWYNDFDRALNDLKFVTARASNIDLNTGSYAWLRLGQIFDLTNQRAQAVAAYRSAVQYAPGSDAAHQAEDYLGSRYKR